MAVAVAEGGGGGLNYRMRSWVYSVTHSQHRLYSMCNVAGLFEFWKLDWILHKLLYNITTVLSETVCVIRNIAPINYHHCLVTTITRHRQTDRHTHLVPSLFDSNLNQSLSASLLLFTYCKQRAHIMGMKHI